MRGRGRRLLALGSSTRDFRYHREHEGGVVGRGLLWRLCEMLSSNAAIDPSCCTYRHLVNLCACLDVELALVALMYGETLTCSPYWGWNFKQKKAVEGR